MYLESNPRDRVRAALPVLAVHSLLALLVLRGLGVATGLVPAEVMTTIDIAPPPPPAPRVRPVEERSEGGRREGAAAPANREARPNEITAPPPVLPPVNPIQAAPVASPDRTAPAPVSRKNTTIILASLQRSPSQPARGAPTPIIRDPMVHSRISSS